jgi:hypothetical protein
MVLNFLFSILFVLGVYYLIRYQMNLKMAAENSQDALYPRTPNEFASVLIPAEWKEMELLNKEAKSYLYVKWGTGVALVLLTILMGLVLFTDWLGSSFFSMAYFFFMIINAIPHRGNLYILQEGIILNGRYHSPKQVKSYHIEEIVRWHELYGLDDRVNYGFKLTFNVNNWWFLQPNFVVVSDKVHLDKIVHLLNDQGINGGNIPVHNEGQGVVETTKK